MRGSFSCIKHIYLVHRPKGAGAEHPDLLKVGLLQDPQQCLVRCLTTGGQRLHQLNDKSHPIASYVERLQFIF